MRRLSHHLCHPCRKPRSYGYDLAESGRRKLALQSFERRSRAFWAKPRKSSDRCSSWPVRQCELPAWSVAKLNYLLAQVQGTWYVRR